MLENCGLVPTPLQKEEHENSTTEDTEDKKIMLAIAVLIILEVVALTIFWGGDTNVISSDRDSNKIQENNYSYMHKLRANNPLFIFLVINILNALPLDKFYIYDRLFHYSSI